MGDKKSLAAEGVRLTEELALCETACNGLEHAIAEQERLLKSLKAEYEVASSLASRAERIRECADCSGLRSQLEELTANEAALEGSTREVRSDRCDACAQLEQEVTALKKNLRSGTCNVCGTLVTKDTLEADKLRLISRTASDGASVPDTRADLLLALELRRYVQGKCDVLQDFMKGLRGFDSDVEEAFTMPTEQIDFVNGSAKLRKKVRSPSPRKARKAWDIPRTGVSHYVADNDPETQYSFVQRKRSTSRSPRKSARPTPRFEPANRRGSVEAKSPRKARPVSVKKKPIYSAEEHKKRIAQTVRSKLHQSYGEGARSDFIDVAKGRLDSGKGFVQGVVNSLRKMGYRPHEYEKKPPMEIVPPTPRLADDMYTKARILHDHLQAAIQTNVQSHQVPPRFERRCCAEVDCKYHLAA